MNLLVSVECHLVFAASLPPRLSERPVEEVADCLIASRGVGKILVEQSFLLGFPDNLQSKDFVTGNPASFHVQLNC